MSNGTEKGINCNYGCGNGSPAFRLFLCRVRILKIMLTWKDISKECCYSPIRLEDIFRRRKLILLHKAKCSGWRRNSRSSYTSPPHSRSSLSNANRFMYTFSKIEHFEQDVFCGKFHFRVLGICCLKRYQKQNNKINLMSRAETWYEIMKFQREKAKKNNREINMTRWRRQLELFSSFYSRFGLRHMVTSHYGCCECVKCGAQSERSNYFTFVHMLT